VADLELKLAAAGDDTFISLLADGKRLALNTKPNDSATIAAIAALSELDAQRWPEFVAYMNKAAAFLETAYATVMPRLPKVDLWSEGLPLALLAWKLRRQGGQDMFRIIRSLSMSTIEFLDEWFESESLKAAIASLGVYGVTLGAMSAGTGFTLLHQWMLRGGLGHRQHDGLALTQALVDGLLKRGGQLRNLSPVTRVLVENSRAVGVELASGEQVRAPLILSAADPRHSLLTLIGAVELPPEFVWQTQSIKMRGSVAKIQFKTNGQHGITNGTYVVAPTLKYIERAYDAAKYGEIAEQPYLEISLKDDVVIVHWQSAPYRLKKCDWNNERDKLATRALELLTPHFPKLTASVVDSQIWTPLELEKIYGLTEGDLNHGQLILDQLFFMRPLPGWSNHRTPIDHYYLCGAGVHGGGGISGISGRNAAKMVLNR
jgi:phytoene dehydrogenase-like protein